MLKTDGILNLQLIKLSRGYNKIEKLGLFTEEGEFGLVLLKLWGPSDFSLLIFRGSVSAAPVVIVPANCFWF